MKQIHAIRQLMAQDRQGRQVFTHRDLATLFPERSSRTLQAGLGRLVKSGILMRAAPGIYVNALSGNGYVHTLEQIARALRRGEYSYISLESALSEHGVISQIPMRLTVMTTGRKGEFNTPFGTIEFTHTARPLQDILDDIHDVGRPLRLAGKHKACRDLKRVGRNTTLIDEQILHEND